MTHPGLRAISVTLENAFQSIFSTHHGVVHRTA
jgi:hypothetical protein